MACISIVSNGDLAFLLHPLCIFNSSFALIIQKYIHINYFFRRCRGHHPGSCPNIDIVKQYRKKSLNYKIPDIPMPDKYIEEVLKDKLAILEIDKQIKLKNVSKSQQNDLDDRDEAECSVSRMNELDVGEINETKLEDEEDDEVTNITTKTLEKTKKRGRKSTKVQNDCDMSKSDVGEINETKLEDEEDDEVTNITTKTLEKTKKRGRKSTKVQNDCDMSKSQQETSVQTRTRSRNKTKIEDDSKRSGGDKISPKRDQSVEIVSVSKRKLRQTEGFEVKSWLKERDILVIPPDSRVKPHITHIRSVVRHDYKLWKNIEKDISVCRGNYSRVSNVCQQHYTNLPKSTLVVSSIYNIRI